MRQKLILASASPRRKDLLEKMGVAFEVVPSLVEENFDAKLAPEKVAEELAFRKANWVAQKNPKRWVLGADTIVVLGSEILGKPNDRAEAKHMLSALSGSKQKVITGISLISPEGKAQTTHDVTELEMRKMTAKEIEDYLDSGEWKDKAGAYAIQETADRFVTSLKGSFNNVVGLPTELLGKLISDSL